MIWGWEDDRGNATHLAGTKELWSGLGLKAASIFALSSEQKAHRTPQGNCFNLLWTPRAAKTDKRLAQSFTMSC